MMSSAVVLYPADGLQRACTEVSEFGTVLRGTVSQMAETMYAHKGVGLAAPQVGLSKRLFIMDPSAGEKADELRVLVNPRITWRSPETETGPEGCLSMPGLTVNVARSVEVSVEYQDVTGQSRQTFFTGFPARIVQHELDHLDGVLMVDRAAPMERRMALKNLSKMVVG